MSRIHQSGSRSKVPRLGVSLEIGDTPWPRAARSEGDRKQNPVPPPKLHPPAGKSLPSARVGAQSDKHGVLVRVRQLLCSITLPRGMAQEFTHVFQLRHAECHEQAAPAGPLNGCEARMRAMLGQTNSTCVRPAQYRERTLDQLEALPYISESSTKHLTKGSSRAKNRGMCRLPHFLVQYGHLLQTHRARSNMPQASPRRTPREQDESQGSTRKEGKAIAERPSPRARCQIKRRPRRRRGLGTTNSHWFHVRLRAQGVMPECPM